jgi:hypothetical protein
MLQVFHTDVAKVDIDVLYVQWLYTYVASFGVQCFISFVQMHVASLVIWMLHMFSHICCKYFVWMLHMFAMNFKCFSCVFASVLDPYFKCFIYL